MTTTTSTAADGLTAKFIPVTDLQPGMNIAGATVLGTRLTKSGKTVFITVQSESRPESEPFTFGQSTRTNIAVFS